MWLQIVHGNKLERSVSNKIFSGIETTCDLVLFGMRLFDKGVWSVVMGMSCIHNSIWLARDN